MGGFFGFSSAGKVGPWRSQHSRCRRLDRGGNRGWRGRDLHAVWSRLGCTGRRAFCFPVGAIWRGWWRRKGSLGKQDGSPRGVLQDDAAPVGEVGGAAGDAGGLGAKAKAGAAKPKIIGRDRTSHLDPAVLASAREAGIQEEQLQDLGRILKKDNKLADLPGLRGKKNELSETEEEEELIEDEEAGAGGEPIQKAVIQLTKIVGSLAKPKKSGIEALMEGLDSVNDSSSGSGGGKTKAAAYKKLRSSLVEQPKYVFQTVEELMDQDFAQVRSGPGLASVTTSSLEHRSRLQNFPNTVRLAWQIAGAHDALKAGNTNECRARLSLLLVALDQAAVDSGAWTLAQEILLEHGPPYQAFAGRKATELWEQSSSKILPLVGRPDVEDKGSRCLPGGPEETGGRSTACERSCRQEGPEGSKGLQRRGEGCSQQGGVPGVKLGTMPRSEMRVPGSSATTVHAESIWELLFDVLCGTTTKLSQSFTSARTSSTARRRADFGQVWPIPLPYPEVHLRRTKDDLFHWSTKKAINFCVHALNFLSADPQSQRNCTPALGTPLNKLQWSVVRQIRPMLEEWNKQPPVSADAMGRAASKVESVEEVLAHLEEEVKEVAKDLRSYCKKVSSGVQHPFGPECQRGTVVGQLQQGVAHVAKAVEPDRLRFWKNPSFDPTEYLDPENAATYVRPLAFAAKPEEVDFVPPKVKVRIRQKDRIRFLELLDSTKRLGLLREEQIRPGYLNGVFCVPKDGARDRMVLDARPPNGLESTEERWIKSLASTQQLQHYFLEEDEKVRLFAEDIREFYHAFKVSHQRMRRNALAMPVTPDEVRHLSCFDSSLETETVIYPALSTMAMGDCNAVSYGQASHLGVILQSGALALSDFVTLTGRPSNRGFIAGLMIDDLVILQKLKPTEKISHCEARLAIHCIRRAYDAAGLPRHEGKAVEGETSGSFWGLQMDGEKGWVRPNLSRCIPLVRIIAEVVRLRHCTVSLLEVISGSLVSVFQRRRRFLSVLEEIYAAQRGRAKKDIVFLSRELQTELLCACALVGLTVVDFRLRPSSRVVASDSSSTKQAAVACQIGVPAVRELQKHCLQKGLWNRLLSPSAAYLREKGLLSEDGELPDKQYMMHPAFEELVSTQSFKQFGKVTSKTARSHINVGEMRAALLAERLQGALSPGHYYLHLQDSQVSLAALVKGRSSSRHLNLLMKQSIAYLVGANIRPFYAFVRSAKNPADDPTRSVPVRDPVRAEAEWFRKLEAGETDEFERFLEEADLHAAALQGLPEASELGARVSPDTRTSRQCRREERAATRSIRRHQVRKGRGDCSLQESEAVGHAEAESVLPPPRTPERDSDVSSPAVRTTEEEELEKEAEKGAEVEDSHKEAKEKKVGDWRFLLREFSRSQFVWSKKFKSLEEALASGSGILDLYSGARGISRACASAFPCWTLTFDIKHRPSEDLSLPSLQQRLLELVKLGAFRAMVAGPVCASFSTAITPPCRTAEFPEGVPWCSPTQQAKNVLGNNQLLFVLLLVDMCQRSGVRFSVENPNGSWMWKQKGKLSWDRVMRKRNAGDLKVDYCMFGCPWQKRTRFRTDLHVAGQSVFCKCGMPHIRLRGRCAERGMNWTQVAEPYPRALCSCIAAAIGIDCKFFLGEVRRLDVSACARGTHARIGEASHPGPRRPPQPRSAALEDVELLEPASLAIRAKVWENFVIWVDTHAGKGFFPWVLGQPDVLVDLLISYGHAAFKQGISLMYFRQLLAHVQHENLAVRPYMALGWQLVSKWEQLEPTVHRPPVPHPVVLAMAALGLAWSWPRWTATLVFSFFGACRVGEVISARREHLLLPSDLLSDNPVAYLKIVSPKSRRRGPRVQYATFDEKALIPLLECCWRDLQGKELLYGGSPGAFRSRWDAVMRRLQIPTAIKLTPGSLRAGGAVWLHVRGLPISDVMWRLRLQHQKTLSYYLQELTAESILPSLPESVRNRIRILRAVLPVLVTAKSITLTERP